MAEQQTALRVEGTISRRTQTSAISFRSSGIVLSDHPSESLNNIQS